MTDSVYNSTTISYAPGEEVGGLGGGGNRPWNLSELVSPPGRAGRCVLWVLLIGGSLLLGLGLILVVIGIYNQQHVTYSPPAGDGVVTSSRPSTTSETEAPQHWIVSLIGVLVALIGLTLLFFYCRQVHANRSFCHPLSSTRDALRKVITKPRLHGQNSGGTTLLSNDGGGGGPLRMLSTQYDPVPDLGRLVSRHVGPLSGGDVCEERAQLMTHEAKEGMTNGTKENQKEKWRATVDEMWEHDLIRDKAAAAIANSSHYKRRHFAGHGYGISRIAPLAKAEEMTPSLRSSYASVLMYAPSSWSGDSGSRESFSSALFVNELENDDEEDYNRTPSPLSVQSAFS